MTIEQLTSQAISAAIKQDWHGAIDLNQRILEQVPDDIPTLNRLAKAYKAQGLLDDARLTYKHVVSLDKYNGIAIKNLKMLENFEGKSKIHCDKIIISFIDEPGKTTTATLCKVAGEKVTNKLQAGQILKLIPKNHWISVNTLDDVKVGVLADEASFRLKRLINGGNQYQVAIKSISSQKVTVFIKETYRAHQFHDIPSFQTVS